MTIAATVAYEDHRVEVHQVVVGPLSNNVFIVRSKATGQGLLIDAADLGPQLVAWSQAHDVDQVLTTHGHHDHIGAVPSFRDAGVPVGIGPGPDDGDGALEFDFTISDGQRFSLGDVALEAIATPGHTSGSTCFRILDAPVVFTGDTLFPGGPGATRSPTSSFPQIIESISTRLFTLEDNTHVLPGHGLPTTIGTEKPQLDAWISRGW